MNSSIYILKYIFLVIIIIAVVYAIDIIKRINNFRQRFRPRINFLFYPKYAAEIFVKNVGKGTASNIRMNGLDLDKLSISFEQINELEPGHIRKMHYQIYGKDADTKELMQKFGKQVLGFPFFPGLDLDSKRYTIDAHFENKKNVPFKVRITVDRVNENIFYTEIINS